jgi:catechol 2,3-dioxygenase-like lactoylglutathione lyase family enzyme
MAVAAIDHYTVLTNDLEATKRFYCEFLGLTDGPRPPFNFPGAWLYAGSQPVVHVVAGRPFSADTGTGGVDHVAFMAKGDPDAMMKRLEGEGLKPSSRFVPATKIRQVFCRDPSGVQVELNYPMT